MKDVREECRLIKSLAEWNRDVPKPMSLPVNGKGTSPPGFDRTKPDSRLSGTVSTTASTYEPFPDGDDITHPSRSGKIDKPQPVQDPSTQTVETKPRTDTTIMPTIALSPWVETPDDWDSTNVWETEASQRDIYKFSDKSQRQMNTKDQTQELPEFEINDGDNESFQTASESGVIPASTFVPADASDRRPPDEEPPPVPRISQNMYTPPQSSSVRPTLQTLNIPSPDHTQPFNYSPHPISAPAKFPIYDPFEPLSGRTSRDNIERPLPSLSPIVTSPQSAMSDPPPNSKSYMSTFPRKPVSMRVPPARGQSVTPVDPSTENPISPSTVSRQGSISTTDARAEIYRQTSFRSEQSRVTSPTSNVRHPSISSTATGRRPPAYADPLVPKNEDGIPTTQHPIKSFYLKAVAREQVGAFNRKYQSTAISESCLTVALLTNNEFLIYAVGEKAVSKLICCGGNDGRYGPSPDMAKKDAESMARPRTFSPMYIRAVLSDRVLCIACVQNCVDVHVTPTGRRIGTIQFQDKQCSSLKVSPNGWILAVGMESGEVYLYTAGSSENFVTTPRILKESVPQSVRCLAFSNDSRYLAACTSGNVTHIYSLKESAPTRVSTYNRDLTPKQCRTPYVGVTAIAL